ncbi:MAG: tetratricopeptide repeat protein [Candidatus Zixiibacteriota bacterium]
MRTSLMITTIFLVILGTAVQAEDSLSVYLKKGGAAFGANDYPKALEFFHRALDFDSINVNALRNLGVLYSMKKDYAKSLEYLKKALAHDTTDPEIYNSLGISYSSIGDTVKAVSYYRRAVSMDANNLDFLHNLGSICVASGKHDEARKILAKMITLDTADTEAHFLMGNIFLSRKDYAGAEKFFDVAAGRAPKQPRYLYYQGLVKDRLRKQDDAEAIYKKALEYYPDYFEVHQRLGVLYIMQEKFAEALAQFREAARIKPDDIDTQVFLGAALVYNNMPDEAEIIYDSLAVRNPEAARKMLNLIQPEGE